MVRVGCSGFSYDDWQGAFYPPGLPRGERLSYYARHFDCVEVNSSFYRQPTARALAGMAAKVPPEFRFAMKAYGGISHDAGYATRADFRIFAEALAPLRERELLGCVLVQFPQRFHATATNRAFVARLREEWPELPLAVEFRRSDWLTRETFELLAQHELAFCCVDLPALPHLPGPLIEVTAPPGYVRFHGRNEQKWHEHDEAWERYDYDYTSQEIAEWVPRVADVASRAGEVYVFFNNHFEAQAADNARDLAERLRE